VSYWNRPYFPEYCGDSELDDTNAYDTMVRMAGSFNGESAAFKVITEMYGWKHIVLISDSNVDSTCWYIAEPLNNLFGNDNNYTFIWMRLDANPTDEELDDSLEEIRRRTRGVLLSFSANRTSDRKYMTL